MPPQPTDLILVSVLKDKRDLEIVRVLGWYRIPFKTAPKTVAVDWLAFYQTAKFGDEKWAIHYVAPVRGHELTTRRELLRNQPNHPRANELYYKIQLGQLERLPRPIPSRKWRRLTFLYTTGERLLAAVEINDLIIQSEERELLWKALRERGLNAERQYETQPRGEVDFALLCALGNLGILIQSDDAPPRKLRDKPPWRYLTVPSAMLGSDLPGVLEQIEATVSELGGLKP
ncbi:MAG: hypothetical protein NZM11_00980 [Anaerolineales bacterium]|nr:hypothetical protein [Anaerolineales bacterium]